MGNPFSTRMLLLAGLAAAAPVCMAHVPFIESDDYTEDQPFLVEDVEQSKAIYAWLKDADDVDVYVIPISEPSRLYVKSLVPYCKEYVSFRPSFAVQGPQISGADPTIPLTPIPGSGIEVRHDDLRAGAERPSMYEFFSNQFYFEGPIFQVQVTQPGLYRVIFWNPAGEPGDYVAIIGRRENFSRSDWARSMENTPIIRRRDQLHLDCTLDF